MTRAAPAIAALATLASLVACGRPPARAPQADPTPTKGRISLERRPCFGACPVYTVTLERSGAVIFEGRRFVADTGTFTGSIPAARADSLFHELEAAGWFAFADRYGIGEPGCERFATDLPSVVTEVRIDGRTKRVEHDYGCTGAPAKLEALERRIDEVAGVRKWVGREDGKTEGRKG
ncbi:MAG: DUF6438 domain-containing protein [Gemmatimonadales bacterium]